MWSCTPMSTQLFKLTSSLVQAEEKEYGQVLGASPLKLGDLEPYLFFSQRTYTRNLLFRNQGFELMVLCWRGKQKTSIHNHCQSKSWVKVIFGEICEEVFCWRNNANRHSPPLLRVKRNLAPNQMSYLDDEIGVHSLESRSEKAHSVTLHLYSLPLTSCYYIDSRNGLANLRPLNFYSKYGQIDDRICEVGSQEPSL